MCLYIYVYTLREKYTERKSARAHIRVHESERRARLTGGAVAEARYARFSEKFRTAERARNAADIYCRAWAAPVSRVGKLGICILLKQID